MKKRSALTCALMAGAAVAFGAGAAAAQDGPGFDQILAAPDDVQLNLDFAIAEANAGNLLSASAALERILLAQPGAADVRLFYAALLIRLDDLQAAENQLDRLDLSKLSPVQRQEARRYRGMINNRRSVFTWGGDLSIGVAYEDDAVGALGLQFEPVAPLTVFEDEGASAIVSFNLNGALKLNEAGNVTAYWEGGYFEKEGVSGIDTDYQRLAFGTGVAVQNRMSDWRLGLVVREYEVSGTDYLQDYGLRVEGSRRRNTRDTLFGGFEVTRQQYVEPTIDAGAAILGGTHDGERYDAWGGISRRLNARQTISGQVGLEHKDASYDGFDYYAARVQAGYTQQLDKAAYVQATGRFAMYDYADPDFYLGGVEREENRLRLRAAVGAPLSYFSPTGATGDAREDIAIEGAVTYDRRDTDAPLADFDSWGAELRLVARFGSR